MRPTGRAPRGDDDIICGPINDYAEGVCVPSPSRKGALAETLIHTIAGKLMLSFALTNRR